MPTGERGTRPVVDVMAMGGVGEGVEQPKRNYCGVCRRPQRTCLCDLVKPLHTDIEVVIWQHPSERDHAKGSAQLLHLCLPNSRLVLGEQLSAKALGICMSQCALLYPAPSPPRAPAELPLVRQLLLLDGTWRKSRRLLHLNPWLNKLQRLPLEPQKGAYVIRKAEQSYQLSTFEAAVLALQRLEPQLNASPLRHVFTGFVERVQSFQPPCQRRN